ncbi:general odorant-binding protein 66-like [Lutzomyia longipalpis]|uniref:Proteinral odorant-binding protein 67 n=1 Tax=Lutzomyia longipalpis TaxID=7200 RepID=A0A1B0CN55_LUTLO|nr:general odorant-binding protein 66-like [Lutzomyia longipalpis]
MQKYLVIGFVVVALACNATNVDGKNCVPPNKANPKECCHFPRPINDDQFHKCVEEFGKQTRRNLEAIESGGPARGCCVSECVMNSTGAVVDGHIDVGIMKRVMKEVSGDVSEWEEIVGKATEKCIGEAEAKTDEFEKIMLLPPLNPDDRVCNPKFGFMMECIMKELYLNCPEKIFQKDKPECEELKTYMGECPYPKKKLELTEEE